MAKNDVIILYSYWLGHDEGIDIIENPSPIDLESFKGASKHSVLTEERLLPVWRDMFEWYERHTGIYFPSQLKGFVKGEIWESVANEKDERNYLIKL